MKLTVKTLAVASAFAFATTALADGPGPRRSVKDAPAPAGYNWTGAYIGLNGGYGWDGNPATWNGSNGAGNAFINTAFTGLNTQNLQFFGQSPSDGGFIGGAQIGYNFQVNNAVVAGIEADIQYADIGGSATNGGTAAGVVVLARSTQQLDWFGTLRGRLGLLLGSDRLLAYVTGGLAYGNTTNSANIILGNGAGVAGAAGDGSTAVCAANAVCFGGRRSGTDIGWTLGGGLEWAISRQLTFRAEYLHIDLGSETVGMRAVAPSTGTVAGAVRFDNQYDIVRAALNFRF